MLVSVLLLLNCVMVCGRFKCCRCFVMVNFLWYWKNVVMLLMKLVLLKCLVFS